MEPEPAGGLPRMASEPPAFFHVAPDGAREPYSSADNKAIARARVRGQSSVRISDVTLPNGTVLQFEVRFGDKAVSPRMPEPPPSRMIQVNLASHNTRVVVESLAPRPHEGEPPASSMEPAPAPAGVTYFEGVTLELVGRERRARFRMEVSEPENKITLYGDETSELNAELDGQYSMSAFTDLESGGGGIFGRGVASPFYLIATVAFAQRLQGARGGTERIKIIFGTRKTERNHLVTMIQGKPGLRSIPLLGEVRDPGLDKTWCEAFTDGDSLMTVSSDGQLLFTAGASQAVRAWKCGDSGKNVHAIETRTGSHQQRTAMCIEPRHGASPHDTLWLGESDGRVSEVSVACDGARDMKLERQFVAHNKPVTALVMDAHRRRLWTASKSGDVSVWHVDQLRAAEASRKTKLGCPFIKAEPVKKDMRADPYEVRFLILVGNDVEQVWGGGPNGLHRWSTMTNEPLPSVEGISVNCAVAVQYPPPQQLLSRAAVRIQARQRGRMARRKAAGPQWQVEHGKPPNTVWKTLSESEQTKISAAESSGQSLVMVQGDGDMVYEVNLETKLRADTKSGHVRKIRKYEPARPRPGTPPRDPAPEPEPEDGGSVSYAADAVQTHFTVWTGDQAGMLTQWAPAPAENVGTSAATVAPPPKALRNFKASESGSAVTSIVHSSFANHGVLYAGLDDGSLIAFDYSEFMDDPRGGPDPVPIRVCQAHHSSLRGMAVYAVQPPQNFPRPGPLLKLATVGTKGTIRAWNAVECVTDTYGVETRRTHGRLRTRTGQGLYGGCMPEIYEDTSSQHGFGRRLSTGDASDAKPIRVDVILHVRWPTHDEPLARSDVVTLTLRRASALCHRCTTLARTTSARACSRSSTSTRSVRPQPSPAQQLHSLSLYAVVACAGAFHVALELSPHGTGETTYEFSYGWHDEDMTGVFSGLPKACDMHTYRESVELGHTWVSRAHVDKVIAKSEESWHAWDYHMLTNNCGAPTPLVLAALRLSAV